MCMQFLSDGADGGTMVLLLDCMIGVNRKGCSEKVVGTVGDIGHRFVRQGWLSRQDSRALSRAKRLKFRETSVHTPKPMPTLYHDKIVDPDAENKMTDDHKSESGVTFDKAEIEAFLQVCKGLDKGAVTEAARSKQFINVRRRFQELLDGMSEDIPRQVE